MQPPEADDWVAISHQPLPVEVASQWVGRPDCGAIVVFSGTTRDHSEGRPGVSELAYEAYEEQVVPRMEAIVAEARARWVDISRMALLHRIGVVAVGDSSVVVAVSSPHRPTAFDAARFGIDTLKSTAPIWKQEKWDGGESWGLEAQHIEEIRAETDAPAGEAGA